MNGSGLVAVVVNLDTDRSRIYGANIFIIHSIHIDHVSSQPCHKACIVKLLSARDPCVERDLREAAAPDTTEIEIERLAELVGAEWLSADRVYGHCLSFATMQA